MVSVKHITRMGTEKWLLPNGKFHREDGPAIIFSGREYWYLNGIKYSKQEHKKIMRLKKLKHIL